MDSLSDRITNIIEHWYLSDSALFQVVCLHELVENSSIACPVRCGRRRIEYNPEFLENMTDTALDEALRMEAVRIILKHPYERISLSDAFYVLYESPPLQEATSP